VWTFPFFSSRWNDVFAYGQVKTEFKLNRFPFRPYVSLRMLGDLGRKIRLGLPQDLSENALIFAGGVATPTWHGLFGWAEAGLGVSYLAPTRGSRTRPDYRGGAAYLKGFGPGMGRDRGGWFVESDWNGVYVSRFDNDFLGYLQHRAGFSPGVVPWLGGVRAQVYWLGNVTFDVRRMDWANYVETGPGVRLRWPFLPRSLFVTVDAVRGIYTVPQHGYRRPVFADVRAGFGYAVTR
jgi:hypothetical protein